MPAKNIAHCSFQEPRIRIKPGQDDGGGLFSASFSCSFLRAARIISSLRLCNIFCRASLFVAQPGGGDSSSRSFPLEFSLACRLYRVIRSGGRDFNVVAADVVTVSGDVGMNDIGGWKEGGACDSEDQ